MISPLSNLSSRSELRLTSEEPVQKCIARDETIRACYAQAALSQIPRLLGSLNRNPFSSTYGAMDREHWHYRTSAFPSEMYQEGVLPLALVFLRRMPGNRWYGVERVRDLVSAALHYSAKSSHADGSCDDYYPWERALGAAVFSLQAAARAYQLLELNDPVVLRWIQRRSRWIIQNDESGRLANHHALAMWGLYLAGQVTGGEEFYQAAENRLERLLQWQSKEGWFEEYGGADPGYQTVTIDCLAKYYQATKDSRIRQPLVRAVGFAHHFSHPDGSYSGEYGSRGTSHFYPHGFELLASENWQAAELADRFLEVLRQGEHARFEDDRMYVHQLAGLMEAYHDWSLYRPQAVSQQKELEFTHFSQAGLIVQRQRKNQLVVSTSRGGVFKMFSPGLFPITDTGLVVETAQGQLAVSQMHDRGRLVRGIGIDVKQSSLESVSEIQNSEKVITADKSRNWDFEVSGPLHWVKFESMTPWKQALLHMGMESIGRWCRGLVRRALQRRLITGRRESSIVLCRRFQWQSKLDSQANDEASFGWKVIDTIRLLDDRTRIQRMSFSSDLQAAYVAACGGYQRSILYPWTDLTEWIELLNNQREISLVRWFPFRDLDSDPFEGSEGISERIIRSRVVPCLLEPPFPDDAQ